MDLSISLSNTNFAMIHIIYKTLVLTKNHMNYLKDYLLNSFLRSIIESFLKSTFFHNI